MQFVSKLDVVNRDAIPRDRLAEFDRLSERVSSANNRYVAIRIEPPRRPRTVGKRSQNSRHWGHCSDIAEQLISVDRTYTKEDVDAALRRMSVGEGLRTFQNIDGNEEAIHHSEMSMAEADLVERVKRRFADEHGLWLTEYDDTVKPPIAYRSVGGRTRQAMEVYDER